MFDSLWKSDMPFVQWGLVVLASVVAAGFDIRRGRIPNMLTLPVWAAGIAWSGICGGLSGIADSLLAGVILAAPFVALYLVAGGGAGDAKLMSALGAWLGTINGLVLLAAVMLAGMMLGVAYALRRRRGMQTATAVAGIFLRLIWSPRQMMRDKDAASPAGRIAMPYGVAICIGAFTGALAMLLWRI